MKYYREKMVNNAVIGISRITYQDIIIIMYNGPSLTFIKTFVLRDPIKMRTLYGGGVVRAVSSIF